MTAFLVISGLGALAAAVAYQWQTAPARPAPTYVRGVASGVFLGLWGFVLSVVLGAALLGMNVLALLVR